MEIIAKIGSNIALVKVDAEEWARLQGKRYYTSDIPIKFDVSNEINISELYDFMKQLKDGYIGAEADAIVDGANKIIKLASKMKEMK